MSRKLRFAFLLAGLLAFGSPLGAQNKPKPGGKGVSATPQEYQQVLSAGEITGKISRIDHLKRFITIQVEVQSVTQPAKGNNQGQNAQTDLIRQQQQLARQMQQRPNNNRNPGQQARQMQQLQRQQAQNGNRNNGGGPKIQTVKKEFEFQADAQVKVRLMSLPQEYDERGKPKQYTQAELKELKGPNSTLPGYLADFENLSAGQTVKLYVASAKKANAAKPAKPAKDKDADVDKDVFVMDAIKPRTTMVLITKDEGNKLPTKAEPKKKK